MRLADNKIGELADWDIDKIEEEFKEILNIDMEQFGFIFDDEAQEDEIEPEVPFTEELREEHNYVVLFFDNEVDWAQAETLFRIGQVRSFSTRKDGKITRGNRKIGVGRVLNGAQALERIRNEYQRELP